MALTRLEAYPETREVPTLTSKARFFVNMYLSDYELGPILKTNTNFIAEMEECIQLSLAANITRLPRYFYSIKAKLEHISNNSAPEGLQEILNALIYLCKLVPSEG